MEELVKMQILTPRSQVGSEMLQPSQAPRVTFLASPPVYLSFQILS